MLEADAVLDRREFAVSVAFEVAAGERLALFGPSGSGKTTTLEMIAGLLIPRQGRIVLGGRILTQTRKPRVAVPPWRRRVGLLRQDPCLFPHLPVRENLGYGSGADPRGPETASIARQLGIGGLLDDRPARISGGQAHRVALGRLLLARCDALLLDEPYTGLDASLRRVLTGLVRDLAADRGIPAVLVAHELTEAQAFADRLAVLDRGTILQAGPPEEVVLRPATRRVAELVGYSGFVPAGAGRGGTGRDGAGRGGTVAGVHPERVAEGADPARGLVITGTVRASRPSGAGWEAELDVAGESVRCRLPGRPAAGVSGELTVTLLEPPCYGDDGRLLPWPEGVPR